jgi:hypothetical protein
MQRINKNVPMKKVTVALGVITLSRCYPGRSFEAVMGNAELVGIDTVMRYESNISEALWKKEQQLTWRDDCHHQYISYVSLDQPFRVGIKMAVLRTR